jgi:ABC-type glycerol-3-phosphate transport system substrate-binding protein
MDRLEHAIELYVHRRISRAQLLAAAAAAGLSSSALLPMIQAQAAALPARPKQSARGPARITFIKGPHSPNEVAIEQRLITIFEKQHPSIKVNFTMYEWPSMDATLEAAYASPTPPDVAYLVDMVYPKFASAGALENLAPYVSQASYQSEMHAFLPAIWALGQYKGAQYGIPSLGAVYHIFYNKDLFKKAGITRFPETQDDLLAATRKLRKGNTWGITIRTSFADYAFWDWFPYIHDVGANILTPDLKKNALNTPKAIAATQFLADLQTKYKVAPPAGRYDWAADRALFKAGRTAMQHGEGPEILELQAAKPGFAWDIALAPKPHGAIKQTVMGNFGFLMMSSRSPNKAAAWEFMKFWSSAKIIQRFGESVGLQLVRTDVPNAFKSNPMLYKLQHELFPHVQGIQAATQMRQMLAEMWPSIESSYHGQISAAEAIHRAAQQIDTLAAFD